jgi:hypothetical protein
MSRFGSRFVLMLVALVACSIPAFSQYDLGSISGTVRDQQGALIPNASVTVVRIDSGLTRATASNGQGLYTVPALPAGQYKVTATSAGFRTTESSIGVVAGETATRDFNLAVGTANQDVFVSSEDSQVAIQTSGYDMSQLITSQQLEDLPSNGRSLLSASLIGPGAQPGSDTVNGGLGAGGSAEFYGVIGNTVVLSGQSNRATTFLQDGVDNYNLLAQSANILPSIDATQQVNVVSIGAPAKYAQPSTINVITKQGTNKFHGSAYDYLQNDDLNAISYFALTKPPERYNLFGGDVGGPIIKDKLFFLFDYSGLRNSSAAVSQSRVPTAAERMGDFSADASPIYDPSTYNPVTGAIQQFPGNIIPPGEESPFSAIYFKYFPLPNTPLQSDGVNYVVNLKPTQTSDQYLGRLDWNINDSQHLMTSVSRADSGALNPTIVPGLFGIIYVVSGTNISVEHTWALSPRTVNVFRAGYNRSNVQRSQQGAGAQDYLTELGLDTLTPIKSIEVPPLVSITGCCGLGDPYSPQGGLQNLYQYADEINYVVSKHTIAIGGEFVRTQFNGAWTVINNGFYIFSPYFTSNHSASAPGGGFGLADAFLGLPQIAIAATGQPFGNFRQSEGSIYAQDDWKVTPNLVLNLGIRYQVSSPPKDNLNRASIYDLQTNSNIPGTWVTNLGDVAPRVGFAWNFAQNTVIRGGYGIYYASTPYNFLQFTLSHPPNYFEQANVFTFADPTPIEQAIFANPSANVGVPYTLARRMKDPSIQQFNLDVERNFAKNYLLSVAYVGNLTRHASIRQNANQATPINPNDPTPITDRRQYQYVGDVFGQFNTGSANYNSLQAKIERRFASGLSLVGSYTYSKSLDLVSQDGASLIYRQDPGLNYAPSDFDRRHQLTFSYVFQLPFGPGHPYFNSNNWVDRDVIGGWQLSGITRFGTGVPLPVDATDLTDSGGIQQFYANQICDPNKFPTGQHRSANEWFNTACFVQPVTGVFGTARNAVRQPNIDTTDVSLMKVIQINDRIPSLQIRGDFFNAFNHPQLLMGETTLDNPALGHLVGQSVASRVIQLSGRLFF